MIGAEGSLDHVVLNYDQKKLKTWSDALANHSKLVFALRTVWAINPTQGSAFVYKSWPDEIINDGFFYVFCFKIITTDKPEMTDIIFDFCYNF